MVARFAFIGNNQRRTSNSQHPKSAASEHWMLDVRCWLLDVSVIFLCVLCVLSRLIFLEIMAGFLDEIEPLKQTALAELKAAADLAALEQTKGAWIGPHGKFTALMKQLGTLSKEERPAAGKLINAAKVELESALTSHREELELKAALPKEPTDFTLPGLRRAQHTRRPPRARHAGHVLPGKPLTRLCHPLPIGWGEGRGEGLGRRQNTSPPHAHLLCPNPRDE